MSNPLFTILERFAPLARGVGRMGNSMRHSVVGFTQDFWKDGDWTKPVAEDEWGQEYPDQSRSSKNWSFHKKNAKTNIVPNNAVIWHALPGEISEKMWGAESVSPCDDYISECLIRPLGINKDMSLLDLSAGLGARLRKTMEEFNVYIGGLEPDREIAARGMAISESLGLGKKAIIETYDPMKLNLPRKYDCIIARETIYRASDQKVFIKSIIDCCKPKAQVSFTDYIVNPEAHDLPAVEAWRVFESGANPMGLVEIAETWAKSGISLRVHEDLTDHYKKEVKMGLVRFAKFMHSGVKPDVETKKAIEKCIMTWAHRMAAMEQGLKFYRFYGVR